MIPVIGLLAVQWLRSDERQARRLDQRAQRDGDRELHDYNEYLRQLNARSQGPAPRSRTAPAAPGADNHTDTRTSD